VADPNVHIQESKALTGDIEPGRRSRLRRVVTSGPFAGQPDEGSDDRRDLPVVGERPKGPHGVEEARSKEGEQT
jgi:formate dehydrogenase major subunit